ncbi:MAG: M23 family metallopeptidase [Acidimicrobiales bacterium]
MDPVADATPQASGSRWMVVALAALAGRVVGAIATWALTGRDAGAAGPSAGAPGRSSVEVAAAIGPLALPTDCPLQLDDPDLLPNAARDYRGGVHEGVDFICRELGHDATTPLPGRVMVAARDLPEPTPEERVDLLADAKALGDTPPWTLRLLYGQFVVIDHGVIDGAGHVVTLYAHLAEVDPALRPGLEIPAGTRVGAIGESGTQAAGTGEDAPYSIHLHWEVQVDDEFLGRGDDPDEVRAAYRTLFGL